MLIPDPESTPFSPRAEASTPTSPAGVSLVLADVVFLARPNKERRGSFRRAMSRSAASRSLSRRSCNLRSACAARRAASASASMRRSARFRSRSLMRRWRSSSRRDVVSWASASLMFSLVTLGEEDVVLSPGPESVPVTVESAVVSSFAGASLVAVPSTVTSDSSAVEVGSSRFSESTRPKVVSSESSVEPSGWTRLSSPSNPSTEEPVGYSGRQRSRRLVSCMLALRTARSWMPICSIVARSDLRCSTSI